jgi:hydroxyethylthiazole kinase-like sugar kinase family protein
MKTQSHTPLPWKYTPDSKEKDGLWDVIVGANGEQVIYGIAGEGCSFENEEADAAFIVRSTNNFENMLTALKYVVESGESYERVQEIAQQAIDEAQR